MLHNKLKQKEILLKIIPFVKSSTQFETFIGTIKLKLSQITNIAVLNINHPISSGFKREECHSKLYLCDQ